MPKANEVKNVKTTAEADLKKEITTAEVKEEPKTTKSAASPAAEEVKAAPAKEEAPKATGAKPGRKPKAAKAAAKTPAEKKTTTTRKAKEFVCVQYAGKEFEISDIVDRAKKSYTGKSIKDIKVYVKPEENMAYYVINGSDTGCIEL